MVIIVLPQESLWAGLGDSDKTRIGSQLFSRTLYIPLAKESYLISGAFII